jgi:hypothetical protein
MRLDELRLWQQRMADDDHERLTPLAGPHGQSVDGSDNNGIVKKPHDS